MAVADSLVVDGIDWANHTYAIACGAVNEIELADGSFRPETHNGDADQLDVEVVSAEEVPGRDGFVLVQLACVAGGPGAALSQQLYLVMELPAPSDDAPAASVPSEFHVGPTIAAAVIAEPGATHVVTSDGVVVVDDVTFGADDPNCCPSVFRSQQVVWDDAGRPAVVEGSRPDTPPAPDAAPGAEACVGTELAVASAHPAEALLLEQALSTAGFDPGAIDGVLDDAAMNAVTRFIEFNAGNPALHDDDPNRPYENLHAEATDHGIVRRPVIETLGIGCPTVVALPPVPAG
jgi:hypothetical protein